MRSIKIRKLIKIILYRWDLKWCAQFIFKISRSWCIALILHNMANGSGRHSVPTASQRSSCCRTVLSMGEKVPFSVPTTSTRFFHSGYVKHTPIRRANVSGIVGFRRDTRGFPVDQFASQDNSCSYVYSDSRNLTKNTTIIQCHWMRHARWVVLLVSRFWIAWQKWTRKIATKIPRTYYNSVSPALFYTPVHVKLIERIERVLAKDGGKYEKVQLTKVHRGNKRTHCVASTTITWLLAFPLHFVHRARDRELSSCEI